MELIHIPRLTRALEQTETFHFSESIPGLETLTPVQGVLRVAHRGTFLEVSAAAETIVTLMCDRCLQQYNYRLSINPTEMIWLDEAADDTAPILLDQELDSDDLVETLPPQGYFDPTTWLYEQLCLELPQRKLCDAQCQGIQVSQTNEASQPAVDRRWAGLEALRNQLSDKN
ncbi:MAG: YceD family protein [Leptolyngbyaceae cyanobacterium bins.349]|nr:YceD family protein [Leptolyngbyaceae cyanobacterium bins.349]